MTQAWNLSQLANKVNTSGQLDVSTGASGTLPIANGGTNNASLAVTAGGVLYTDGSKVVNVGAGTSGQALKSNGASPPSWGTAGASSYVVSRFTSSATFIPQATCTGFWVFLWGSNGGCSSSGWGGIGGCGYAEKYYSSPSGTYTIVIGAGGTTSGTAGGTTSFNSTVSITGSGGVTSTTGSAGGVATGGDFNANGGTGGSGFNDGFRFGGGGSGGAGSRAGNGYAGGNGTGTNSGAFIASGGGGGGTGGIGGNATLSAGGTGGIAATSQSASAIALPFSLSVFNFAAGATGAFATSPSVVTQYANGGSGAGSGFISDIQYFYPNSVNAVPGGYFATAGNNGYIWIIEKLG